MKRQTIENLSPRLRSVTTDIGMDAINLKIGKQTVIVQPTNHEVELIVFDNCDIHFERTGANCGRLTAVPRTETRTRQVNQ